MEDLIAEKWKLDEADMRALRAAREAGLTFAAMPGKTLLGIGAGINTLSHATHQWDRATQKWERIQ